MCYFELKLSSLKSWYYAMLVVGFASGVSVGLDGTFLLRKQL
jgi:hypothetical protein